MRLAGIAAFAAALAVAAPAFAQDAFPVTIGHAFGETVIPAKPERIVTISWMSQDVVLALGEVPVGIQAQTWGGDEYGVLPWVGEALAELGAERPVMLDSSAGLPFEQILALEPDVILARYSGLTDADYERLSAIAPTVAYLDQPWSGSWQEITRTVGLALGKSAEAEALIEETMARIAEVAAEHPEFAGKTFVFSAGPSAGSTQISAYVSTDPRVQLMEDLGFVLAPGAAALPTDHGFYVDVSFEQLDTLDADLLVAWHNEEADREYVLTSPLLQRYRPIAEGHYLGLVDRSFVMATSAPSPLSIPWALDALVPQLSELLAE